MAKKKKSNKNHTSKTWMWAGLIVIVILGIIFMTAGGDKQGYSRESVDAFATCLTENGATMYGAYWCPHCANTKKKFGSSFQYIDYVECDPRGDNEQSELCLQEEIEAYDTWRFADGSEVIGEPSFETLAQKTGCPLPQ